MHQKDGATLWEDGHFAGKLEGVGLEEDIGFGRPGWYRSVETKYEEEGERVVNAELIVVGAGAVYLAGRKAKRPGVFVEVLRDR